MKKETSTIKAVFIAACVACLLYSSGLFVILTPFPLYFVSTCYGKKAGRLAIIFSLVVVGALYLIALPFLHGLAETWPTAQLIFALPCAGLAGLFSVKIAQVCGIFYMAYFVLFAYLFSEGTLRKWSFTKWLATSAGWTFALLAVGCIILEFSGVSIAGSLGRYMHGMLNELIAAQEQAGLSGERAFAIKKNADAIVQFSLTIMPSIVLLMGLLIAVVNQLAARWMIRTPKKFKHLGDLCHFSAPYAFTWITILLGFGFFFNRYVSNVAWLNFVVLNGLIVCGGIYLLQGLFIASFYLRRLKGRWFKAFAYAIIFIFIQATAPALAIIGFTDLWIDFRRLLRKKHKSIRVASLSGGGQARDKKESDHGSNSA